MHTPVLYYIHDPMCSWCWAFKPARDSLFDRLPDELPVIAVLGGLAPDSSEAMPEAMQNQIKAIWHRIQTVVPGTDFNFDFWRLNTPRRSTYPACRAVIAARNQGVEFQDPMIQAIQEGYYLKALNPSDADTLIELASAAGLNRKQFALELDATETQKTLEEEIRFGQQIGANGFPSLVLGFDDSNYQPIVINYNDADAMLSQIKNQLSRI